MTDQRRANPPAGARGVLLLTGTNAHSAGSRVLVDWCRRLPRYGFRPFVAFPGGGRLEEVLDDARIPHTRADLTWPSRFWPIPFWMRIRRLSGYVRANRIAMIHCDGENDFRLGREVAAGCRLPVCCHVHFPRNAEYCRWMFGKGRRPDRLLCCSESVAARQRPALEGIVPPDRVRVVPNGVDTAAFVPVSKEVAEGLRKKWNIPRAAFCVGVVASINPHKQCHHLPRLVAAMRGRGVDAVGVLAGPCQDRAYFEQLMADARRLGVDGQIVATGQIEDMAPAYGMFDVVVSFSIAEGLSLAALEAMACGKVVLSYDHPSQREAIGQAGFLVPMNDVEAAAAICCDLAAARTGLEQLGAEARRRVVEEFSVEKSVEKLVAEYEAILQDVCE